MPDREFFHTTVEVEVVSDQVPDGEMGLLGLHHFISTGGGSGAVTRWDSLKITPAHARELLIQQSSTPEFLDLQDDDGPRKERLIRTLVERMREAMTIDDPLVLIAVVDDTKDELEELMALMGVEDPVEEADG